ncbi:MAG: hypothetical protein IKV62_07835 [Bacteroidales bacterium]|nr:hypothetical protein [Bacteroidales bacterium]
MKKVFALFLSGLLALGASSSLFSQDFETGYFLGGNPYAFRLNPAFQSERGIFSIGLGQTGLGTWSNLGISTLLYPSADGRSLYTFMNDNVSSAEFLRKIKSRNSVDLDMNVNLLTVGFWSNNSFFTIDFNVRSLNGVGVPYDLFRFLKEGTQNVTSFDLSGTGFRSKTFAEAAVGWSRRFGTVSVGARTKVLVGLLEAEAQMKNLKMTLNEDKWEVRGQGELRASSPALRLPKDENGELYLDDLEFFDGKIGPAGYGAAVDLGVSWDALPYLTVSAAILDLGTIRWNREIVGQTPETGYTWTPSEEPVDGGGDAIDRELEEAGDALAGLFRFKDISGAGNAAFEMLPFRVNLGAEFRMPFYERLSVGALYTGRAGNIYARHTCRFSLNWNPADWFSMSTTTTLNKLGESFGFALNLHPAGVNLVVGCDYIPFSVVSIAPLIDDIPAKYERYAVIPANRMNMNLYISLNLALGRRHLDHARRILY